MKGLQRCIAALLAAVFLTVSVCAATLPAAPEAPLPPVDSVTEPELPAEFGTLPETSAEPAPEAPAEPGALPETPTEPTPELPAEPDILPETPAEPAPETPAEPSVLPETPAEPAPETPAEPGVLPEPPAEPAPEIPTEPGVLPEPPAGPDPETPTEPEVLPETPPLPEEPPAPPSVVLSIVGGNNFLSLRLTQNYFSDFRPLPGVQEALSHVHAWVQSPDGTVSTMPLRVDWSIPQEYPVRVDTLGFYPQHGAVLLPDDTYVFADGVPTVLTLPVEVIDHDFTVSSFAEPADLPAVYTVAQNGDLSPLLEELPTVWECYEADTTPHLAALRWDTSTVDLSSPGVYTLSATPDLPLHGTAAEDLAFPVMTVPVSVQSPDSPELHFPLLSDDACFFPWILPGEPAESPQLSLWTEEGPLDADAFGITWDEDGLTVPFSSLTRDTVYSLSLAFPDCATGTLTFSLEGDGFHTEYDASLRGQWVLPEEPQPEPEPEPAPEPLPEQPLPEKEKEDREERPSRPKNPKPSEPIPEGTPQKEILGADLLTMISDGPAAFSENHMTALFSKESIWDLDVKEEDILSVLLKAEGENAFSIAVTRNGVFVEEFKDLQIEVPYETETLSPVLTLVDESGSTVASGEYDSARSLAAFTIDRTGRYTIVEEQPPVTEEPVPVEPVIPATPTPPSTPPSPPASISPSRTASDFTAYIFPASLILMAILSLAAGSVLYRKGKTTA